MTVTRRNCVKLLREKLIKKWGLRRLCVQEVKVCLWVPLGLQVSFLRVGRPWGLVAVEDPSQGLEHSWGTGACRWLNFSGLRTPCGVVVCAGVEEQKGSRSSGRKEGAVRTPKKKWLFSVPTLLCCLLPQRGLRSTECFPTENKVNRVSKKWWAEELNWSWAGGRWRKDACWSGLVIFLFYLLSKASVN